MKMNLNEISQYFKVKEKTIKNDFPRFATAKLKKGILINRFWDSNNNIFYTIEKVEPRQVDISYFYKNSNYSRRNTVKTSENSFVSSKEQWLPSYVSPDTEVSNFGRFRDTKTHVLRMGSINSKRGYQTISIKSVNYQAHRIVLQTWDPIDDFEEMTVDHKNGVRSDNRLENLQWVSAEENTQLMLLKRQDLNRELTRIIQKLGYEGTLELLKKL